jgi:CubicO group peptidase (beta-lactamase class C family)
MQMILRSGLAAGRDRLLKAETIETMARNQIGDLSAGKLKSVRPATSADVDFHPGFKDGFGLGFLINAIAYSGGRSAGTLAWAGLENTYYWIDRRRALCAVVMMRFHPFGDPLAMGLLSDFEHAVYASV